MRSLVRASHAGPTLAVVLLATLLAVATGLPPARVALVAAAVLAGQLSIGWSNDLLDEGRDRAVGRTDKPLVGAGLDRRTVQIACGTAVVACVALSLACGWWAGVVHLVCVGSGWAYNLGLKSTWWSWAPYAVSFGGLVVFVFLAATPPAWPPWWLPAVAALLGVGAHLLNVLPDLEEDADTGVHGLPHRLGPRVIPRVAAGVLLLATLLLAVGIGITEPTAVVGVAVACVLAVGVLAGRGRVPFVAAVLIAFTDVALLLTAT